jgi:hypothetical protein
VLLSTVFFSFHHQASLLFPPPYAPSTADEDGPDIECSSKVAQNVQADITYFTELYVEKNRKVQQLSKSITKWLHHPYFKLLYNITRNIFKI